MTGLPAGMACTPQSLIQAIIAAARGRRPNIQMDDMQEALRLNADQGRDQ
jgi:hypothetical protein